MTTACSARLHNTEWAYRRCGCRCPEAVKAEKDKAAKRHYRKRSRAQRPRSGGHDYDWVKVERAVNGDMTLRLTFPELAEAIDRLDRRRWSAEEIAQRLGVTQRTVQRRRATRREAEAEVRQHSPACRTQPADDQRISDVHRTANPRQDLAA